MLVAVTTACSGAADTHPGSIARNPTIDDGGSGLAGGSGTGGVIAGGSTGGGVGAAAGADDTPPTAGRSDPGGSAGAPLASDSPDADGFYHPGIFSTRAELDSVKTKVQAGAQPWKAAFDELARTNPTAHAVTARAIVPGSAEPTDRKDMNAMTEDGEYAYAAALLWYVTGERKYADHAIKTLNAWSVFQKTGMPLYLTWAAPHFVNAAELMRHTPGAGWEDEDIQKFAAMVAQRMWPIVQPPKVDYGSNHGATALESMLAIAVFLGDRAKLEQALDYWTWLFPKYVFLDDAARLDGECNETCRDLSHMNMGMLGLMYSAETAWNQKHDLWKPGAKRWTAFAELHAGIMSEGDVPARMCERKPAQAGIVFCSGNVPWSSPSGHPPCKQTAWDVLINHVGDRLGQTIPLTRAMASDSPVVGGISRRNSKWETLLKTHDPTSL